MIRKRMREIGLTREFYTFGIGAIMALSVVVATIGLSILSEDILVGKVQKGYSVSNILVSFLLVMILALLEEVICRGFLLQGLRNKVGLTPAIIISSTFFVIINLDSLWECKSTILAVGLINLYSLSIFSTALVLREKSLWPAIGLNSVWNFLNYCVIGTKNTIIPVTPLREGIISGGKFGMRGSIYTTFLFVISSCVLFGIIKIKNSTKV